MADRNLRQLLSIICHNPTDDQAQKTIRNLRFRHSASTPHWNYFESIEGQYDWGWYDGVMDNIMRYTTIPPVCQLFQAPAWVDRSLKPRGEAAFPWVPYLPVDKVPRWEAFVEAFMGRYTNVEYINLDTETTIEGTWKGTPEEYANNVIVPAAKIVHRYHRKIVAPGTTIQKYESDAHYVRSKDHMKRILAIAFDYIDKISIHSYAKNVARTLEQTQSFIKDCGLNVKKNWVTETGFPEDHYWVEEAFYESLKELGMTGRERQLKRFREFLTAIETQLFPVERWTIYRGFDTQDKDERHGTNGLLSWRMFQKPAGVYVMEQLMEDKPKGGVK